MCLTGVGDAGDANDRASRDEISLHRIAVFAVNIDASSIRLWLRRRAGREDEVHASEDVHAKRVPRIRMSLDELIPILPRNDAAFPVESVSIRCGMPSSSSVEGFVHAVSRTRYRPWVVVDVRVCDRGIFHQFE